MLKLRDVLVQAQKNGAAVVEIVFDLSALP